MIKIIVVIQFSGDSTWVRAGSTLRQQLCYLSSARCLGLGSTFCRCSEEQRGAGSFVALPRWLCILRPFILDGGNVRSLLAWAREFHAEFRSRLAAAERRSVSSKVAIDSTEGTGSFCCGCRNEPQAQAGPVAQTPRRPCSCSWRSAGLDLL